MENKMQIFNHDQFGEIRGIWIEGEPWLVGRDVATALGYAKPENAIATHVDPEDKTTTLFQGNGSNYKSNTVLINESGLYALIFGSKLPGAKRFKHWVTSEVLPALRKTGSYNGSTDSTYRERTRRIEAETRQRNAEIREQAAKDRKMLSILDNYSKAKNPVDKLVAISFARSAGYGSDTLTMAEEAFKKDMENPVRASGGSFTGRKAGTNTDYANFLNYLVTNGERKTIHGRKYIVMTAKEACAHADLRGVDFSFFMRWARDGGYIEIGSDGKSTKSVRLDDSPTPHRCVVIPEAVVG